MFLSLFLDYREKCGLCFHLDRFYCKLRIFHMQKYTLKNISASGTFLTVRKIQPEYSYQVKRDVSTDPGFYSLTRRSIPGLGVIMWVEFVVSSILRSEWFFSG